MSTLGDESIKLIKEAKRSGKKLVPYNQESVGNVFSEIATLTHEIEDISVALKQKTMPSHQGQENAYTDYPSEQLKASAVILHYTRARNKQCLMAYHKNRLDKLITIAWELGSLGIQDSLKEKLHSSEQVFLEEYRQLIRDYNGSYLDVDVGASLIPPKDVIIEVRVLKDCGQIMTDNGPLRLMANSQHYLRRIDVERFISQGYIKHVE